MSSYLLFCIYFSAWYITYCPKRGSKHLHRVIGDVLVLGLLVNNPRPLETGFSLPSFSADTLHGWWGIAMWSAGSSGTLRHLGGSFGLAVSSFCSKANHRHNVSGTICNFPDLCFTVESYECNAIAQRVNMFEESCTEYKILSATWLVTQSVFPVETFCCMATNTA